MRWPAKSATRATFFVVGAWTPKRQQPTPRGNNSSTTVCDSAIMSCPVIPRSTLPSPTYVAMSAAGRNTSVTGRLEQSARSTRGGRWYSRPAPWSNVTILSWSRPFLGTAKRRRSSGTTTATSSMDETTFLQALAGYPVVRTSTYCRVQWNDVKNGEPIEDGTTSGLSISKDSHERVIQSTDSMEEAMKKFLGLYFSSHETAKIQQQFGKIEHDFIASLCLEDVNDLCAQFVNRKRLE
ncbi:hypothetical protein PsorP6_012708 [Peronosclerospora sorghi]|uniref:Uncharacterized protein n=1 Tax=Peronosclerospora sorghi TaxID=230839 RepID=A0ACC0WH06_9STRA|nr:hypothetical protein PsorP6_012708 [Peronosclerospora sorghi]